MSHRRSRPVLCLSLFVAAFLVAVVALVTPLSAQTFNIQEHMLKNVG